MSVRLNGSTSGFTELDAQASPGNNTLKFPASNGSARQAMRNGATPGTMEFADDLVLMTAQNTTSGASIDFTGIPSWVKRVTVMLNGVSTNGAAYVRIQLGTASGVETSGYQGATAYAAPGGSGGTFNSSGFDSVGDGNAVWVRYGTLIFTNISGNNWLVTGTMTLGNTGGPSAYAQIFSGSKSLSGALDRIRITTTNGTDTFDAGTINVMYE